MGWGASLLGASLVLDTLDDITASVQGDVTYIVGSGVEYAVYLEYGTSNMPAYPWMRPAVEEFRRSPEAFVAKNTNTSLSAMDSAEQIVGTVALAMERQLKKNVTAAKGSGRSPGTDPEHPAVDTGNLKGSIRTERIA